MPWNKVEQGEEVKQGGELDQVIPTMCPDNLQQ